jgi:hypothetical protein
MAYVARDLQERAADATALRELLGPAPDNFQKPPYNTPPYELALRCGWISAEEEQADRAAWEQRRLTSLQTCHRYSLYERPRARPDQDPAPLFYPSSSFFIALPPPSSAPCPLLLRSAENPVRFFMTIADKFPALRLA